MLSARSWKACQQLRASYWGLSSTVAFRPKASVNCRCPIVGNHLSLARWGSSSSSRRWQARQGSDRYAREAKVQGLKSRAAFKLLEINEKYNIFRRGQTVVDLGYAPGSWSQVAVDRTRPNGRVLGIDMIPASPPKGASTIQGNFLDLGVREEVKKFLRDPEKGRLRRQRLLSDGSPEDEDEDVPEGEMEDLGYIDRERHASSASSTPSSEALAECERGARKMTRKERDEASGKTVDVVLSDMSAPWPQTSGFWNRSLSMPYYRMMNTSGIAFRDHAGSMDLCNAALRFATDTLRPGSGSFICKFYQGAEDKALEMKLKKLFRNVHREKPESSRSDSREGFFVALRRKEGVEWEHVVGEGED